MTHITPVGGFLKQVPHKRVGFIRGVSRLLSGKLSFTFAKAHSVAFVLAGVVLLLSVSLRNEISWVTRAMLIKRSSSKRLLSLKCGDAGSTDVWLSLSATQKISSHDFKSKLGFAPLSFSHVRNWTELSWSFLGHASSLVRVKINVKGAMDTVFLELALNGSNDCFKIKYWGRLSGVDFFFLNIG